MPVDPNALAVDWKTAIDGEAAFTPPETINDYRTRLKLAEATAIAPYMGGGFPRTLESVTDWSTAIAGGWTYLAPSSNDQLTRAGANRAVTFAAGGMTIKTNHVDSYPIDDNWTAPIGVSRPIDDGTVTWSIHIDSLAKHTSLVGGTSWGLRTGIYWGAPDTMGAWAGTGLWYSNAAAGTAGDPKWRAFKEGKLPNATIAAACPFHLISAAATPADVYLHCEWSEENGFKGWWSPDGTTLTEVGGGTVPAGYWDPLACTTTTEGGLGVQARPAGQKRVYIVAGCNFNIPAVANSIEARVVSLDVA